MFQAFTVGPLAWYHIHTQTSVPTQSPNRTIHPTIMITYTSSRSSCKPPSHHHSPSSQPSTTCSLFPHGIYPINPSHSSSSHAHVHSALQSAPLRACPPQAPTEHHRSDHRPRRPVESPFCWYPCVSCGDDEFSGRESQVGIDWEDIVNKGVVVGRRGRVGSGWFG